MHRVVGKTMDFLASRTMTLGTRDTLPDEGKKVKINTRQLQSNMTADIF
jgi:hypothetical protein